MALGQHQARALVPGQAPALAVEDKVALVQEPAQVLDQVALLSMEPDKPQALAQEQVPAPAKVATKVGVATKEAEAKALVLEPVQAQEAPHLKAMEAQLDPAQELVPEQGRALAAKVARVALVLVQEPAQVRVAPVLQAMEAQLDLALALEPAAAPAGVKAVKVVKVLVPEQVPAQRVPHLKEMEAPRLPGRVLEQGPAPAQVERSMKLKVPPPDSAHED